MKSKLLSATPKTFVIIFDTGDEVMSGLIQFAKEQQLGWSHFTAIGAFDEVTVGFFSPEKRDYNKVFLREQVEVLSLLGDVALKDGAPQIHAHVVLGKADASACGGHLINARVRPTLEVVLTELRRHLHRTLDAATGLALIKFE